MISEAMQALYAGDRERAESLLTPGTETVFEAAALGRLERLEELLGAEPELARSYSPDGFTPLHLACFSGGAETARLLVERGADLEALARSDFARVRPLGTAAFSGDRAAAAVLLEAGADPNGRGEEGFTPLHSAAQNGDDELVRLLLQHGADADATTEDGRTAADLAPKPNQ
jgi:ankyrin repeat protein